MPFSLYFNTGPAKCGEQDGRRKNASISPEPEPGYTASLPRQGAVVEGQSTQDGLHHLLQMTRELAFGLNTEAAQKAGGSGTANERRPAVGKCARLVSGKKPPKDENRL